MIPITVTFVQLPETARAVSEQAAREVWPHARCVTAASVAEASRQPATGRQLLVLGEPDEAAVGLAAQTLDASDLPRWALVCLGRDASDLAETVAPENWNAALLAHVFRATFLQHELLRENLRLRGDLKTISRRVVHDARSPIGCIQTLCELIRGAPAGDLSAVPESLALIGNSTAEINLLIDRVNSLVQATLDPLPPAIFPMGPVVESALRQLADGPEAVVKKIHQPAQWPEAEGVAAWTQVVWWNLIRNALMHGGEGTVHLGWTGDNGTIRFWVTSAGALSTENLPRLHCRFHQLHQHPSAGFGLSVVERLVALQDGQCGYETADDRAVFHFTLRAPPSAAKEPAAGARSLTRQR